MVDSVRDEVKPKKAVRQAPIVLYTQLSSTTSKYRQFQNIIEVPVFRKETAPPDVLYPVKEDSRNLDMADFDPSIPPPVFERQQGEVMTREKFAVIQMEFKATAFYSRLSQLQDRLVAEQAEVDQNHLNINKDVKRMRKRQRDGDKTEFVGDVTKPDPDIDQKTDRYKTELVDDGTKPNPDIGFFSLLFRLLSQKASPARLYDGWR